MDNATNATYGDYFYTYSYYNSGWKVTVGQIFQGLLTAWVFVSNILLILSVTTYQTRRNRPINLCILNLALVGILASIFVLPFDIYSYGEMWMTLIYVFCAVSAYIFIMISVNKLLLLIKPRLYQKQAIRRITVGFLALPWAVGIILNASLMLSGLPPYARNYPYCLFETELVRPTVMCVLAFLSHLY